MRDLLKASAWGKQKTILVVDDDADLRLGVEIRLKANGYDVLVARDGEESLAAAAKYKPDLILLDLGLPAGDGYHVMEHLRASETTHLIPVVILSARDRKPNRDQSLQGGAYTFLQKPADAAELLSAIGNALGQGKMKQTRAERKRLKAEADDKLLNRIMC